MNSINELVEWAISFPPQMEFKFSQEMMFFYLHHLDVEKTSTFLIEHYHNFDYISHVVINDNFDDFFCHLKYNEKDTIRFHFLNDIRSLLIFLIYELFIDNEKVISIDHGRELLKNVMETKVKYLQFKRTAQTCTPYGFI